MKIITWNVNGLRSVYRKNFLAWLKQEKPDIVCLQEIKVSQKDLPNELKNIKGYFAYFSHAQKPGYSGCGIYTKIKPQKIEYKIGNKKIDNQGRFIRCDFSKFILINLYLPHGGREKQNLNFKLETYKTLFAYLKKIKSKKPIILAGDFNVAHTEIDLARPKQNQNNIMFTLAERKMIDRLIVFNFVDTFRKFNQGLGYYTWWPYRFGAREKNLGWRIDYIFISQKSISKVKKAFIKNKILGSDHCPSGIEIQF